VIRVTLDGVAPIDIDVFLRVSNSPQVALNVPSVNIAGTAGSQVSVLLPVSSTTTPVPYVATISQYYGASGWLTVTPASGTTGTAGGTATQVTLTANLAAVPSGLHYAVVNFRAMGADIGDVTLPVILTVTQTSQVSANPTSLNFAFQAGNLAATTNNKVINITASPSANLSYTATVSGDSRITVAKSASGPGATVQSGTTPENLYVLVNPVGIAAGTNVDGMVTITTANNSVPVPVHVTVTNSPLLVPSTESISFNYSLGGTAPPAQTISLTSTTGTLNYNIAEAEVTGGDWLTVTSTNTATPGNLSVSVNQTRLTQLAAGTYTANITVASPGAGNSPLTIPVTLTISGTASLLNVTTSSGNNTLTFAADLNGAVPGTQTVTVSSTDNTNQAFTTTLDPATASSWLVLSPPGGGQTGTTGTFFTVGVLPTGITAAGKYEADIVVTPQAAPGTTPVPVKVHVIFNVGGTASVTATPDKVTVAQPGGTPPAPVTVQINSGVQGIQFLAQSDKPWVTVAPTSGTLPASLTLSFVTTGMPPGQYDAVVTIAPTGASALRIPVSLTIGTQAALTLSQTAFNVNYALGATAPADVTVGLTSSGVPITFTAAATSTGNWLSVTPTSGTTGAAGTPATNLTLKIAPAGLTAGTYTGTVAVTGTNSTTPAQTVTVTLVVAAASAPVIRSIENAARNEATLLAPGMIIAIKGANLGPATGVSGKITNNVLETTVSEVQVLFDGVPAPILYARQDQVNAIAPYALFGRTSTRVQISYRNLRSDAIEYRILDANPGIFTQDSTGRGLGSILNQNSTVNTAAAPAKRGEIISIYATGEGQVRPAGSDGRITSGSVDSLPRPIGTVAVKLNGVAVPAANITYAGSAPGLVAGAMQINVRIPTNLNITAAAQVPVDVSVDGAPSQPGVTVAVIP